MNTRGTECPPHMSHLFAMPFTPPYHFHDLTLVRARGYPSSRLLLSTNKGVLTKTRPPACPSSASQASNTAGARSGRRRRVSANASPICSLDGSTKCKGLGRSIWNVSACLGIIEECEPPGQEEEEEEEEEGKKRKQENDKKSLEHYSGRAMSGAGTCLVKRRLLKRRKRFDLSIS